MRGWPLDRSRLRLALGLLFVALAAPVVVLVVQARGQMRWEAFHQYQRMADELGARIDADLQRAIAAEEARGYADYRYAETAALSKFPVASPLAGVSGYFQVDADGAFTTPLLPAHGELATSDAAARAVVREQLLDELGRHGLVDRARATSLAQGAFDQLQNQATSTNSLGRVDALPLTQNFNVPPKAQAQNNANRAARNDVASGSLFDSELDPFEFSLLDDEAGVLFRKAWRGGRRTIQGALVDRAALFESAFAQPFLATALAPIGDMVIAWRGDVVRVVHGGDAAAPVSGELLHQMRLSAPFGDLQLVWNARELPAGPGARVVAWSSATALAVLVIGCLALYRLGLRQIALVRQQQDFVAAVSHELKTPLTSVRLYAEILREGWASEEKKREYYDYIHDESERLSRLIANVLQLSRLERGTFAFERKPHRVETLVDLVRSKVARQVEHAGFTATYDVDAAVAGDTVDVDADAFVQMLINLVDNALKFAKAAARRDIVIGAARHGDAVRFSVRDFGPGVEASQRDRIFDLFYRAGDERVRTAPGTGIGLALVRQFARAMDGDADVAACEPGVEFGVRLPRGASPRRSPG